MEIDFSILENQNSFSKCKFNKNFLAEFPQGTVGECSEMNRGFGVNR
jgi:hypothetical protein